MVGIRRRGEAPARDRNAPVWRRGRYKGEGSRSPAKDETAAFGGEASGKGRFGAELSTETSPASI